MRNNLVSTVKVERAIRKVDNYYYVQTFTRGKAKNVKYIPFDTLEEARAFRDECDKIRRDGAFEMVKLSYNEKVYPYNLLNDIEFECNDQIAFPNFIKTFDERIKRLPLTQRELDFINSHYKEFKTLEMIGKEYNITKERVRQIIKKGLYKIKYHKELFEMDDVEIEKYRQQKKEEIDKIFALEQEKVKISISKMTYDIALAIVKNHDRENSNKLLNDHETIECLDLSVRSYNCLIRNGIKTIGDLSNLSKEDLMMMRNLGRKSMNEVLDKLKEYCGVQLPERKVNLL